MRHLISITHLVFPITGEVDIPSSHFTGKKTETQSGELTRAKPH